VITLARIQLNDIGHIAEIDMGPDVRRVATSPSPAAGWLRVPFKPVRLNPVREGGKLVKIVSQRLEEEFEFVVDEASTYCDENGARGSMAIPVPPAAVRLVGFRIAGTTTGKVTVHLYRTGWNRHENKAEQSLQLEKVLDTRVFFGDFSLNAPLDESHAVALAVIAQGETTISLVAAKFQ
jgi:hypothetical protein